MPALVSCRPLLAAESLPPLPEQLQFSGAVSGFLSAGIDPRPTATEQPWELRERTMTRCFDYERIDVSDGGYTPPRQFMAVIVGDVNGERVALGLAVRESASAYLRPGTAEALNDTANYLYLPGDPWPWSPSPGTDQMNSTITINSDHQSGTIEARYRRSKPMDDLNTASATVMVSGLWRCG
ncbi:hypothetical protein ACFYUD_36280 [Nocardia tengchongensis]|uniref:hypothetical protein n=1 Tax=Nocardia tengchongensis TaxID=2055889 RepID=UPI0036B55E56